MNFDIPDILRPRAQAATGGRKRKKRKIGALRLGDSLRMIANHFTCTEERRDEEEEHCVLFSLGRRRRRHPSTGKKSPSRASAFTVRRPQRSRRASVGEKSGADRRTHEGRGRSAGIKRDGYFRRYRDLDLCDTPGEGREELHDRSHGKEAAKALSISRLSTQKKRNRRRDLWDTCFPRSLIPWVV